jgi:DNA-binding IclR family transcriptional regulator
VGVLDKAMVVLGALVEGRRSLAQLTAATELPRATAHRLAAALEAHGLLRRDSEGRFGLGPRLVVLGHAAGSAFPLPDLAAPALEALRAETGESVQLYVRHGDGRLCVASLDSPRELRTMVAVGAVLPLDRGSAGKVLANGGAGGWAQSVAEREAGVASVSAPVRVAGEVVAAVSVSGPIERLGDQPGDRFGDAVVRAAVAVEAAVSEGRGAAPGWSPTSRRRPAPG